MIAKVGGVLRKYGGDALKAIGLITVADKVTGAKDTTIIFAVVGGLLALIMLGRR